VALPLTPLPNPIAAGIFTALATAALLWGGQRVSPWAWLIVLSFPFWRLVQVVNLTLLVAAAYYLPWLGWILPAKPNTGIPVVFTSRIALLSAAMMGLLSLLLYPTWPLVWLRQAQLEVYVGRPLILEPLGWLVLAVLPFVHRSPDARYLLLVCLVPLREFYDPILLLLVARQRGEWLLLVALSWGVLFIDRVYAVPLVQAGTLVWFVLGLPALGIVLRRCMSHPAAQEEPAPPEHRRGSSTPHGREHRRSWSLMGTRRPE
jgi:hypothetical protein